MDIDDLSEEYGIGVAVAGLAALALSPRVRGFLRRGVVAGLSGALVIGDFMGGWVRRVKDGGEQAEAVDSAFVHELTREARGEMASRKQQLER
jgi:hypothetical protein